MRHGSRVSAVLAFGFPALMLAGCSENTQGAVAPPTVTVSETITATVTETVTAEPELNLAPRFSSIEQFVAAAEAAGLHCEPFEQTNAIRLADASGFCGETGTVALYDDEYALTEHLAEVVPFGIESAELGSDFVRLVGPNWMINAPNAEEIQSGLGGIILRADS